MNIVILKGNLANDPEVRATQTGKSMTIFAIRCQRYNKEVDFINCVAWDKTAEFIRRYFSKGKPILVRGSLQVRKYTDKDGRNGVATEVVVAEAEFAGGNDTKPATANWDDSPIENTGDLPF